MTTPDNRAHARVATSLDGRLLSTDGRCNLFCTVIDLSDGGARVRTRHDVYVPARVYLLVMKTGDLFDCEQRWWRENEIGFRFLDRPGRACRKALMDRCRVSPA